MRGLRKSSTWVRIAICAIIALLSFWPALAAPPVVMVQPPCTLTSEQPLDPFKLLSNPGKFDCTRSQVGVSGRFTYGFFLGLNLESDPVDPWELRHEFSQAQSQSVYVRYADGTLAKAPSDRTSARRPFSAGMVSYVLPAKAGRIVTVLTVAEGLQNQRGIAPVSHFLTGRAALANDGWVHGLYGLLAGIVVAMLCYNFALYIALGYPFILRYCVSALAMLGMGISWSGALFLVFPAMTITTQVAMTVFFASVVLATSSIFMLSFIEKEHLSKSAARLTLAAAAIGIASSAVRFLYPLLAWRVMDAIVYVSMIAVLGGIVATAVLAWRRGSRAARIYVAAWTLPLGLSAARIFWEIGLFSGESILFAISPLMILALEALMCALAVTWRIGLLRDERDELRHFAETDSLTGLLNRRAFIAQVKAAGQSNTVRRLIVIDVDRFKLVNDRYGHQAGDDLLIRVANVLCQTAPAGTIIGRIGGEEFALLVPPEPVDALPDRLCRAVEASATRDEIEVTISLGVADGACRDDGDWRRLYYAADQALYRAKNGGRNRVSMARETLAAA
jgi:diguanylate cyclase (GGDEF)-like protein